MKPVDRQTDFAQPLNDKSLMLLNRSTVGLRYIAQLVASESNIQTKTGRSLPIEIWHLILEHIYVDTTSSFCLVQVVSIQAHPQHEVLQCRAYKSPGISCGNMRSSTGILEYEKFMRKPIGEIQFKALRNENSKIELRLGKGVSTFRVTTPVPPPSS